MTEFFQFATRDFWTFVAVLVLITLPVSGFGQAVAAILIAMRKGGT